MESVFFYGPDKVKTDKDNAVYVVASRIDDNNNGLIKVANIKSNTSTFMENVFFDGDEAFFSRHILPMMAAVDNH